MLLRKSQGRENIFTALDGIYPKNLHISGPMQLTSVLFKGQVWFVYVNARGSFEATRCDPTYVYQTL